METGNMYNFEQYILDLQKITKQLFRHFLQCEGPYRGRLKSYAPIRACKFD